MSVNIIEEAKNVFNVEINELQNVRDEIDDKFEELIYLLMNSNGKVIITGMGKSGHIGRKISSTLSSLGISSYFLHPSEGAHGDLGIISKNDVIIAISKSGETEELLQLIPTIKNIDAKLVSITSNINSKLCNKADLNIILNITKEACQYNLAPTSSTTAALVFGDALAIVLSKLNGMTKERFALYHPCGSLGKKLLTKVSDLMFKDDSNPTIYPSSKIRDAIFEITSKGLGAANVIDEKNNLVGILTDGDLRRNIEKYTNILEVSVCDIMTINPVVIESHILAIEALHIMKNRKKPIMVMPVVNGKHKCLGMISLNSIIQYGVV